MSESNPTLIAPSPAATELREQLQALVIADLLGPANGPDEIVEELSVRGRYVPGALAPTEQATRFDAADDEDGDPQRHRRRRH